MRRCKFVVYYHGRDESGEVARFSMLTDAEAFARSKDYSELADNSGLIGQFKNGRATPEFAHLDK